MVVVTYLQSWKRKQELAVESSRPAQSWIDGINPVSCTDDYHLPTIIESIHQRQKCGDDGTMDLILTAGADWSQTVDLIEEDDSRSHLVGLKHDQRIANFMTLWRELMETSQTIYEKNR